jgi:hypothetical protein
VLGQGPKSAAFLLPLPDGERDLGKVPRFGGRRGPRSSLGLAVRFSFLNFNSSPVHHHGSDRKVVNMVLLNIVLSFVIVGAALADPINLFNVDAGAPVSVYFAGVSIMVRWSLELTYH